MTPDEACGGKLFIHQLPTQEIITLYNNGDTVRELAEKYNVSEGTISNRLKATGICLRNRSQVQTLNKTKHPAIKGHTWNLGSKRTPEQKMTMKAASKTRKWHISDETIMELLDSGLNQTQIAAKVGLTQAGVSYRIKIVREEQCKKLTA